MEEIIRDIFPGGNTPQGFYSYYRYILPQENAERIFCLKGGPGVGKSTMMKEIAGHFIEKGESVDMFWCSADPDSLDGVLLKARNISIVDGTSPHIIDPINPGAVDEIVDLAEFLDYDMLRRQKSEIIACSKEVTNAFKTAYLHLKYAGLKYDILSIMDEKVVINDYNRLMSLIDKKDSKDKYSGNERRFFSYAITHKGIIDFSYTLARGINNVFTIDGIPGMKTEDALRPVINKLIDKGFDVELYYSPMCPDMRIEHVISPKADIAILTMDNSLGEHINEELNKVFANLRNAKELHDKLESYYIPAMDFSKVKETTSKIIEKIENDF